jgi:hypothetical protein
MHARSQRQRQTPRGESAIARHPQRHGPASCSWILMAAASALLFFTIHLTP